MTRPDSRPLPRPTREFYAFGLTLAACAAALVLLGRPVRHEDPLALDVWLPAWVVAHRDGWPAVTGLLRVLTRVGNFPTSWIVTAAVALGLFAVSQLRGAGVRRAEPLVWLGAVGGGALLGVALKAIFRRDRPPVLHRLVAESSYSFPSSHSVFAAVFFGMLAVELARAVPGVWGKGAAVAGCAALAVTVAASRVWLGVHYPTDVLGGLILGSGWVLAVGVARREWARRDSDRPGR